MRAGMGGRLTPEAGFKMETWDIGAARQFNAHGLRLPASVAVVRGEFLSDLTGTDADDRIIAGVVADGATKKLRADHALTQAVEVALQGMGNDEAQEGLRPLAASERAAGENLLEVFLNEEFLIGCQEFRFSERRGAAHTLSEDKAEAKSHYSTGKIEPQRHVTCLGKDA